MRAGGGKAKGSAFERHVCVALSRWVTRGKREDVFWRSAMSGGRATVRGRRGKNTSSQLGDISSVAPEGHALTKWFAIECKHVADLNLRGAMINGNGCLAMYWNQTAIAAAQNHKHPMLIARQNNFPTLLFVAESVARTFFGQVSHIERARLFKLDGYRISMYGFEDFMELPFDRKRLA